MPAQKNNPTSRAPRAWLAVPAIVLTILALPAPLQAAPLQAALTGTDEAAADTVEVTSEHYRIFRPDGSAATLADIYDAMQRADVVFVGERHNDPVAHAVERWIWEDALSGSPTRRAALSLEMFSRDAQYIVDEYRSGLITEAHFLSSANPWQNYAQDYKPLVDAARHMGADVIAANAPRRYANMVTRGGPTATRALSDEALRHMAPWPWAAPTDVYRAEWNAIMEGAHMADTDLENMLQAQTVWDATMAWSIGEYLMRYPEALVVHAVGAFHVESGTGIPEHLARYRPSARLLIVTVLPEEDFTAFDAERHTGLADFVILADESLPRTY